MNDITPRPGDSDNNLLRKILLALQSSVASAWTVLSTGSTTPRTLASRFSDPTNVMDFGAVGDGITDDAPAINSAILAAKDGGGVFFPVPTVYYSIGSTILVNKRLRLFSSGTSQVTFDTTNRLVKKSSLNGPLIQMAADGAYLEDLTLDGELGNGGDGVLVAAASCGLKKITVIAQGGNGIRIGTDGAENCDLWSLYHVRCYLNLGHGVYIHSAIGPNANAGTSVHIDVESNAGDGIRADGALFNSFVGGVSELNSGYGINILSNARRNQFMGIDVEENLTGQINVAAGALSNSFLLDASPMTDAGTTTGLEVNGRVSSTADSSGVAYLMPADTAIRSATLSDVANMYLDFGIFNFRNSSSFQIIAKFDESAVAGDTRFMIWDVTKGSLSRVSVGANDSGGAGFKVLRVPN